MKRSGLILTTLVLFALSVYLAFVQGSASFLNPPVEGTLHAVAASPLVYTGFKAVVAKWFLVVMNSLLVLTGKSVLLSIILLALLVELVLLYPSFRIQLKQKKIHLFHKKLVDRFSKGELSVSQTEDELHKLYDVNEKIHHRGATMVMIQMALFFFTFWGLNLMVKAPGLLTGSWSILNFSLLTPPITYTLPLTAGLLYFAHACTKIYFKQKEDYVSSAQLTIAALFAVIGAVVVYVFAGVFAVALTVYFITLITFATIRYIVVEQHARNWGQFAQRELMQMLREAGPHKNRFQYFSRLWNHIPIVRHINFNLLEEGLSMTLGLLLALSFFGAFQKADNPYTAQQSHPARAVVEVTQLD
ncbi:hypothetical protein JW752_01240 [Candidatus Peregrinibacteria bacterium]|nr:hypothetical protein [Candidatus Peregrinibacteria bacterium]